MQAILLWMENELLTCSFTRRREAMRWKLLQGIYDAMDQLKKSFPKDIDYVVPFESVSVVQVSIHEVVKTLIDRIGTGYSCGISFPAKLARNIDSGTGDSGFHHRHIYIFYPTWILRSIH